MRSTLIGLAAGLVVAASAHAAGEVEARLQSTMLSFSGGHAYTNAVLTVTGPNDYLKEESVARGLPVFRLQTAGRLIDGLYQYSLVAASDKVVPVDAGLDNGRGPDARKTAFQPFALYGAFRVEKGLLQPLDEGGADGADSDG